MLNRGIFLLVVAEFCFAAATVFAKFVTNQSEIPAIEITFFRVFPGMLIAALYMWKMGTSFRPHRVSLIIARAVFNFLALVAFFYAVQYGSVTNANMLNMTYPVFIFLLAPLFNLERSRKRSVLLLIAAMAGIYLVIFPDFSHINIGDVIGLCSGIFAAFSIISLAAAREYDSTVLIVFYLMTIGTALNAILLAPVFVMPDLKTLPLLIGSGLMGVVAQIFLTMGYKDVSAKAGSMVSSSRILFATAMGSFFFAEALSLRIVCGGLLIIAAIIGVSRAAGAAVTNDE